MAYASQSGRARTSAKKPRAFAVCMRCGMWENRDRLHFQYDWRGTVLQNLYILVCDHCMDTPQEQLRAIQLPADPVPVYFPSVEDFAGDETDYRSLVPGGVSPITGIPIPSHTLRVTEDCQNRITQPIGCPDGLVQNAVMPYNDAVKKAFGVKLNVLSVVANGTATVAVTCSRPHGLQTDSQVSLEGLASRQANGFYSVDVLTATAFTYATAYNVPAQSLLTPTTRIITALVGLPYGSKTIPKIGCHPPPPVAAPGMGPGQGITTDSGVQITTDAGIPINTSN